MHLPRASFHIPRRHELPQSIIRQTRETTRKRSNLLLTLASFGVFSGLILLRLQAHDAGREKRQIRSLAEERPVAFNPCQEERFFQLQLCPLAFSQAELDWRAGRYCNL